MGKSELKLYDSELHVKESISWKVQQKSLSFCLKDSKGNPVAKANMPFEVLKEYITANDKTKSN